MRQKKETNFQLNKARKFLPVGAMALKYEPGPRRSDGRNGETFYLTYTFEGQLYRTLLSARPSAPSTKK